MLNNDHNLSAGGSRRVSAVKELDDDLHPQDESQLKAVHAGDKGADSDGLPEKPRSSVKKRFCTIPLWLVFIFQSLVVVLSFVAVILVLVLQQQSQFETAVFEKIDLHLQRSEFGVISPLLSREERFTQRAEQVQFNPYMWYNDTMDQSTPALQTFMDFAYFLVRNDPIASSVYQHLRHSTLTHNNSGLPIYSLAGMNFQMLSVQTLWDDTNMATVYLQSSYPLQFNLTTSFVAPLALSQETWSLRMRKVLVPSWGTGQVFYNSLYDTITLLIPLIHPLIIDPITQEATLSFVTSFDVSYLTSTVNSALLSSNSKLMLYDGLSEAILTTVNFGQPQYNAPAGELWTLDTFPDRSLVTRFREYSEVRCRPVDNCTRYAVEDGDDIVSLLYMTTTYGYKLHLFQITPRSFFFADGERSAMIGAVIGVVGAVIVLTSCVVIWFAVRGPILRLRESMELAAVMRNDEVSDTSSALTELDLLSQSFMQMNDKLLQARPFMPQALLYGGSTEDEDEEGEENQSELQDEESMVGGNRLSATAKRGSHVSRGSSIVTGKAALAMSTTSGNESHRSSNQTKKGQGKQGLHIGDTIASNSHLTNKRVAVLMINARGTHDLADAAGPAKLEREQVRLVELVERYTRAEKGVVDAFQGDHFVVTFNAARPVGAPAQNAVLVGLAVEEGARRDGLALGRFSMGMSVGRAHVGNVGSATMKKNCTVGRVYTDAAGLERVAKRVERTFVVNERCMGDVDIVAYCLTVGTVTFSNGKTEMLHAVMRALNANADEWLYEMEQAANGNPYQTYNEAMGMYLSGRKDEAIALVCAGVEKENSEELAKLLKDIEEGDEESFNYRYDQNNLM